MRNFWRPILVAGLVLLCAQFAPAQYQVFSWESFETGKIPPTLTLGHFADEETVGVMDYYSPGVPRMALAGAAAAENGRYGVLFQPTAANKNHLSIYSQDGLNRERLGDKGRALYQVDFFLPAEGQPFPTVSLLAQVLEDGKAKYKFYRFGIEEGKERLFFSFGNDTPKPLIFETQSLSDFGLKRPGWHRFQIIFEGQEKIICAIDAQPTKFSPIAEGTHKILNAGLMVTTAQQIPVAAVADNLSIQWTPDEAPIPDSPWTKPPEMADKPNTTPLETGSSVAWLTDTNNAWKTASQQKRPLLVMFYTNRIAPYEYLKSIVPNDDAASSLFNQYVLLKVDANQLAGGRLAEKFKVFRLPTLIAIGSDSKEKGRLIVVNKQTAWNDVKQMLVESAAGEPAPAAAVTASH